MIKQRRLKFIKCECTKEISLRALKRHLIAPRFWHSGEFKLKCFDLIVLNKTNRCAWKISEGSNALRDDYWCVKVLNRELKLEELTFVRPRKLGENTPEALKKISQDRKGQGNPSLVNKPLYDLDNIKRFAMAFFEDLSKDPQKFKKLDTELDNRFPNYRYGFAGMFPEHQGKRGHNRRNTILSFLINKPLEWIVSEKALDRGTFIKAGQRKSPKFDKMRYAGKGRLRAHITIPHNVLFNMILSVDSGAIKEKHIDCGATWKSYDIFSPKLNALIEMHGHVWHDWHKCKPNMIPLVIKNVHNDVIKMLLSDRLGYRYIAFWDDQIDRWAKQIKELYGKRPKSYKQAHREEIDKKGKSRSI